MNLKEGLPIPVIRLKCLFLSLVSHFQSRKFKNGKLGFIEAFHVKKEPKLFGADLIELIPVSYVNWEPLQESEILNNRVV